MLKHQKSGKVKVTLKRVSYDRDDLYFHLVIQNKGGQIYDVDFINYSLGTAYKGVNTDQTIPLTPIYIHEKPNRVGGNSESHFVVVYQFKKGIFTIADPRSGLIKLNEKEFHESWSKKAEVGFGLLLERTPTFFEESVENSKRKGLGFLYPYFLPYKKEFL